MRKLRVYTLCCLIFCTNIQRSEQVALSTLFSLGLSVFNTALSIVDLVKNEDAGLTQADLNDLKNDVLQDIEKLVEQTESSIILNVMLQNGVRRLENIKNVIQSSIDDLEYYLKTETEEAQNSYRDLFTTRYEEHDVILHIRDLPTLLTDTIPELSQSMISLIWDATNCNMTTIMNFEIFYGNLVSEAVTLEYAYTRFKNESQMNVVEADWNDRLTTIQTAYQSMESECVDRFSDSITKEIKQDVSLEALYRNSNERYNWRWSDAYQYKPQANAHTWNYFVSLADENFLFWNEDTSGSIRIMVFGDKNAVALHWNKTDVQSDLEANLDNFQKNLWAIGEDTAKALCKSVGTFVNDELSFIYKGIFILYEDSNYRVTVLTEEQQSPAAHVAVPLRSGNGVFHIYVYPEIWNNFTSYSKMYNVHELSNLNAADRNVQLGTVVQCFTFLITVLILS